MAPPPESPYTRAVEKADQLLERGLIDPGRYRDIVAGDAQFHIEAARFERDAALRQLEDLSPEKAAARPRDVVFELASPPAAPRDVHFDLVGERLHTIKENDRSSSARSSSASSDAPNPRAAPLGAALQANMPVARVIGGAPAKPRRKPSLLASLVRGVSRRLPSSKKATKLRAWETAALRASAAPEPAATPRAVAPPRPSAPPRPRGRISEQPFSPTDFERQRRVGRGGFGVVYLVTKRADPDAGAAYAMKVLDKSRILRGGGAAQARLERDVLRVLRHPFVARLRYAFQTETRRAPARTSKLRLPRASVRMGRRAHVRRASRPRREPSIRPTVGRIDVDGAERETCKGSVPNRRSMRAQALPPHGLLRRQLAVADPPGRGRRRPRGDVLRRGARRGLCRIQIFNPTSI